MQSRIDETEKMELMSFTLQGLVKDSSKKNDGNHHNEGIIKIGEEYDGKREEDDKWIEVEGEKDSLQGDPWLDHTE